MRNKETEKEALREVIALMEKGEWDCIIEVWESYELPLETLKEKLLFIEELAQNSQ